MRARTIRRYLAATLACLTISIYFAPQALAQTTYTGVPTPTVDGVVANDGGRVAPATQALAVQATRGGVAPATAQTPVGRLALTGLDVLTLVTVAMALIVLGFTLTRRARTRSET